MHVYDGTVQAGGPDDAGNDPSTFGRNLFWYEYLKNHIETNNSKFFFLILIHTLRLDQVMISLEVTLRSSGTPPRPATPRPVLERSR